MVLNLKYLLVLIIICNYQLSFTQEIPVKKDSSKVYRDIEKYSKKRNFTQFIYKLIFEPVAKQKTRKSSYQKLKQVNYALFEGKIIRNIKITTLDPFGYSDVDSTQIPKTFLYKSGNVLHPKTKNLAIRNLLLIYKNKPLDSLLIKESERLIRSQRYISSVTSHIELVAQDSVDVSIRVLDSWSLIPDFSVSTSKYNFYLTEKNFLGTGHEFSNSYTKSLTGNQNGYSTNYFIPTIRNTFISTRLGYNIDLDGNYAKSINVARPFYSPYARWGAGVTIGQNLNKIVGLNVNQIEEVQNAKYNYQDYWAGHSYQIFKGNSEYNRGTNFITSARYFHKNYIDKPYNNPDSLNIYSPEKLYLISFGISSRKFTQDKYIFNFNVTEDVASGFVYNITTGYQKKYEKYQFYTGARISIGSYFEFGYLSGNIEYGTFIDDGKTNQSTSSLKFVYFTNIQEIGKWKLRQFIKPQIIIGNNRLDSNTDKLTLNGATGITGFNSETLFGTKKLLITFQTQGYSPWRLFGFRLNPYFSYTAGILGNAAIGFKRSKVYSQIGLGIIVSNDYLVFSSFQFSFSFYPNIPDGNSIFKTNSISTSDFGLQGFEITKPVLVDYQ
ncbi:hypothetical protein O8E88_002316 [Flavobacterium psychrophilum]|uniref:hypothetical protein n=1 Tax=Flavobacterium psychrophilum TaxID=96345 RepID=UPI0009098CCB|nr:hypothetical protein [Flavobacterium psychrophilum]EKT2070488.1 hypothetical protein [Flavobacterium psychrophilum]EKT2072873.1 hypothetical protein [Flavobacterium psychrophilum]EKT4492288.1 hypothetical protein [Flavobacterium psychrophilum]SHH93971.1 Protein of unknown function [Flavobacterium psychrophilum]